MFRAESHCYLSRVKVEKLYSGLLQTIKDILSKFSSFQDLQGHTTRHHLNTCAYAYQGRVTRVQSQIEANTEVVA